MLIFRIITAYLVIQSAVLTSPLQLHKDGQTSAPLVLHSFGYSNRQLRTSNGLVLVSKLAPGSVAAEPQVEELLAVLGLVGCGEVGFGAQLTAAVGKCALVSVLAVPFFPVATQLGLVLVCEVVRLCRAITSL